MNGLTGSVITARLTRAPEFTPVRNRPWRTALLRVAVAVPRRVNEHGGHDGSRTARMTLRTEGRLAARIEDAALCQGELIRFVPRDLFVSAWLNRGNAVHVLNAVLDEDEPFEARSASRGDDGFARTVLSDVLVEQAPRRFGEGSLGAWVQASIPVRPYIDAHGDRHDGEYRTIKILAGGVTAVDLLRLQPHTRIGVRVGELASSGWEYMGRAYGRPVVRALGITAG